MRGKRIHVALRASDPLSRNGLADMIGAGDDLLLVEADGTADVEVLAQRHFCPDEVAGTTGAPILLVVNALSVPQLMDCVRQNVTTVMPRAACTTAALVDHIRVTAAGGAIIPPLLLGDSLHCLRAGQPDGALDHQLSARDVTMLRMLADGAGIQAIAEQTNCSERTVKQATATIIRRLHTRNRAHAVATAIRTGII